MQIVTNIGIFSLVIMIISLIGICLKYKKDIEYKIRLIWAVVITASGITLGICRIIKEIYYIVEWTNLG